jgi:hypothetical protein
MPAYKKIKKCGKRRFRDALSAKIALSNIHKADSPRRDHLEQGAYLCKTCRGWHLTSGQGMIQNNSINDKETK